VLVSIEVWDEFTTILLSGIVRLFPDFIHFSFCPNQTSVSHKRKRPLGRHRGRCEDNIKMDLREIERDDMDWIHLLQDEDQFRAFVNMVLKFRVP
jgi:hypothetical protein